jgi:hypothetical protein
MPRLIEIWNSLPGEAPVRNFKDRATAVSRLGKAIQALESNVDIGTEREAETAEVIAATPESENYHETIEIALTPWRPTCVAAPLSGGPYQRVARFRNSQCLRQTGPPTGQPRFLSSGRTRAPVPPCFSR